MIALAFVAFALLLVAWLIAPSGRRVPVEQPSLAPLHMSDAPA